MTYTKYVKYEGFDFEVEFYHTPAEPQTLTDPGCPAETELEDVKLDGVSIIELLNEKAEDDILELVLLPV